MPKGIYIRTKKRGGWKLSEETKKRQSLGHKGINTWSKGKKYVLGKHWNIAEHKRKNMSRGIGQNNPNWKGEKVGYRSLHNWVEVMLGKPDTCEDCKVSKLTGHKIHWANKSHEYKRDVNDWMRLCPKCHRKYDYPSKTN